MSAHHPPQTWWQSLVLALAFAVTVALLYA